MTSIEESVRAAIESAAPGAQVNTVNGAKPAAPAIPPRVAGNILKMLERTKVTGMESVGWCEAYQLLQQIALQGAQQGPGVPFQGLGG